MTFNRFSLSGGRGILFKPLRYFPFLLITLSTALPALAQKSTTVNFLISLNTAGGPDVHHFAMMFGSVGPLGNANISLDGIQTVDQNGKATGNFQGTLRFAFSRADSFDLTLAGFQLNSTGNTFTANVTGGKGAYQGATGSANLTLTPNGSSMALSGSGGITLSGRTTSFTLANVSGPHSSVNEDRMTARGGGNLPPLASNFSATLNGEIDDATGRQAGTLTLNFSATDSLSFFMTFNSNGSKSGVPAVVAGGTGAYAGATGNCSFALTPTPDGTGFSITGFGTINQRAAGVPIITEVNTAYGPDEIGQNVWLEIKGTNLVLSSTPAAGVNWNDAAEFASGQMPTILQNVGVNINGQRGYIQFYCSAATNPNCATDQINVLAPLDNTLGPISLFVNNNGTTSAPFVVPVRKMEPAFLDFDTRGHVVAVHLDASLLGPANLYPGFSTPAKTGETILVFGIGFGLPSTPVSAGSATQSGPLPLNPTCYIGANQATIASAYIISPGLTQLALVVPAEAPSGDNLFYCSYQGSSGAAQFTPAGNLIAVQ